MADAAAIGTTEARSAPSVPAAYRWVVAVTAAALFFTNGVRALFETGSLPLRPAHWAGIYLAAGLPLALSRPGWRVLRDSPLVAWCLGYAAVTGLWFLSSSGTDVAAGETLLRLSSALFLVLVLLLFADPAARRAARFVVAAGVWLGAALNLAELVTPLDFSGLIGRSAGLYLNPNIAGSALVAGMIVSVGVLSRRARVWLVLVAGAGVFLTLSRASILGWGLAVILLTATGEVRLRPLVAWVALGSAALLLALLATGLGRAAVEAARLLLADSNPLDRLAVLQDGSLAADYSTSARLDAARQAWELFISRPLTGHGVGATLEWWDDISTHNTYLQHLAEYGILGAALFPVFLAALPGGRGRAAASPSERRAAWILAAFLGFWGVFSHNLLDERHLLLCAGLAAAITAAPSGADGEGAGGAGPAPRVEGATGPPLRGEDEGA